MNLVARLVRAYSWILKKEIRRGPLQTLNWISARFERLCLCRQVHFNFCCL
jgi:hypothetical protein